MTHWKDILMHLADNVEEHFDTLTHGLNKRLRRGQPICIVPYIGFGTRDTFYLKGRVLKDSGVTSAEDNDSIWENLLNMYRRINTAEIAGARLRANFGGQDYEVTTDNEGYYHLEIPLAEPLPPGPVWYDIDFELLDYPNWEAGQHPIETARAVVPPVNAQFGVISDIDDTVLQTDVLHVLNMARNVFLGNSHTRLPFEGVAAFYRALQLGTQSSFNPIFYLSSSAWNLYDLLVDFFEVREIPTGPLMLVDYGITSDQFITPGHHAHKSMHIQTLLDRYPDLPFILIGDSGQKDPEIYLEIIRQNPGRILTAYIRDVRAGEIRIEAAAWADEAQAAGSDMLLVEDTEAAAQHAAEHGYILWETKPMIAEEREADKEAPTLIEQLVKGDDSASE